MLNPLQRFWKRRFLLKNHGPTADDIHPAARSDPYLDELISILAHLEKNIDHSQYERTLEELTASAYRDGFALDTRAETKAALREATSASASIQGTYISALRHSALTCLREHPKYDELCRVPVGMLPTRLLNGQACLNRDNEPLILIDSGMMRNLTEIVHAYHGFFEWAWGSKAYCRDHSQLDFAQTLLMLTVVIVSGEESLKELCPALIDKCPSVRSNSERRERSTRYATMTRNFVLLHEYGHIALGHLHTSQSVQMHIGPATIHATAANPTQEYEADAFAVEALISIRDRLTKTESLDHTVAVLAEPIGILMRFWDLLEAGLSKQGSKLATTHPPAISRWRRIRKALTHSNVKKDFLSDLDDAFDSILDLYKLEPAATAKTE